MCHLEDLMLVRKIILKMWIVFPWAIPERSDAYTFLHENIGRRFLHTCGTLTHYVKKRHKTLQTSMAEENT
jgi:hypothetical protein